MTRSSIDPRTLASDLANIEADLSRSPHRVDDLLAIAQRLSRVASEITLACERAFIVAAQEIAA